MAGVDPNDYLLIIEYWYYNFIINFWKEKFVDRRRFKSIFLMSCFVVNLKCLICFDKKHKLA